MKNKMYFTDKISFLPEGYTPEALESRYKKALSEYDKFGEMLGESKPEKMEVPFFKGNPYHELTQKFFEKALIEEYQGLYKLLEDEITDLNKSKWLAREQNKSFMYKAREFYVKNVYEKMNEVQKSLFRVHTFTHCYDKNVESFYYAIFPRELNRIVFSEIVDVIGFYNYDVDIIQNLNFEFNVSGVFHFYLKYGYASYLFSEKGVPFYDCYGDFKNGYSRDTYCNVKPTDEIRIFKHYEQKGMDCYLKFQSNLPTDDGYG